MRRPVTGQLLASGERRLGFDLDVAESTGASLLLHVTNQNRHRASGAGDVVMMEQRQFGRRTAWKSARFMSPDGSSADCTVVEVSDGGARLQLRGVEPSTEFVLIVPEDDMAVRCLVVHRDKDHVGVRYLAMPQRLSRLLKGSGAGVRRR